MALLGTVLLLFLVSAGAENLTEVKGALGRRVALNCTLNSSDVYWYMEIHSQIRACIGRTFGQDSSSNQYYVSTSKYLLEGNRLVIENVTADDFRLYFCARRLANDFNFEDAVRLVSDGDDDDDGGDGGGDDDDDGGDDDDDGGDDGQQQLVVYAICSSVLNALLISAVTGLSFAYLCLKRKNRRNEPPPLTSENLETRQYEEIQLPSRWSPPPAAPPLECIYYKAQLPRSTQPGH